MKTADNVYMYMRTGSATEGRADCSIFSALFLIFFCEIAMEIAIVV